MLVVVLQLAIIVVALVGGWLLRSFFPSYFSEKGKNLATKQDIAEITAKIEQVKATLASRLHIHQVRYEHEFKVLLELSEKLVGLRDAAMGLRPEGSYGDPSDPELKNNRMRRYMDAGAEFYRFIETRQPFFPEEIYLALKRLEQATWKEFVQYKNQTPDDVVKYWDNALKNGAEIGNWAAGILDLIRDRAKRWERFDPAP